MSDNEHAARMLLEARVKAAPLPAAGTNVVDSSAAYAVQDAVAKALGWFSEGPPRHWKSGAPSADATVTHAPLPPAGVWSSPADAREYPLNLRGIEAEIALRLACDVDAALADELDQDGAQTLIDAMCVAIEIVDSRWTEGLAAPHWAKLADLQSHGALVLGPWVAFTPRDWSTQLCRVEVGAQPLVQRCGTHSLRDPLAVVPEWLRHVTRRGYTLAADTVVTTGTWVGIVEAAPGDFVNATFPGIGQASVQL